MTFPNAGAGELLLSVEFEDVADRGGQTCLVRPKWNDKKSIRLRGHIQRPETLALIAVEPSVTDKAGGRTRIAHGSESRPKLAWRSGVIPEQSPKRGSRSRVSGASRFARPIFLTPALR